MSVDDLLGKMVAAERGSEPPADAADRTWVAVQAAVDSGAPVPVDVPPPRGAARYGPGLAIVGTVAVVIAVLVWASGPGPAPPEPAPSAPAPSAQVDAPTPPPSSAPTPAIAPVPPSTATGEAVAPDDAATPSPQPPTKSRSKRLRKPAPVESSGRSEVELIGAAQRSVRTSQHHAALRHLREHAARFPQGALTEEREALTAVALCGSGDRSKGAARAKAFAQRYPRSTHLDRVEHACETP